MPFNSAPKFMNSLRYSLLSPFYKALGLVAIRSTPDHLELAIDDCRRGDLVAGRTSLANFDL